ncbi:uncharacterized protein [Ambystoma mexicanum]|uniref:uncharacterized protein isoform X2 n=1 Tax=Ambystoma mexicanum TaxID=8296 RepID=UPI0037E86BBB
MSSFQAASGLELPQAPRQMQPQSGLEDFLGEFEHAAEEALWPKKDWPMHLAPLLSGEALAIFQALPCQITEDYDQLKDAILEHVGMSEESYRKKFRSLKFTTGTRPQAVALQLSGLGRKWLKPGIRSSEEIVELIIVEQFIQILPEEAGEWLSNRPASSLDVIVQLIEEYSTGGVVAYEDVISDFGASVQESEQGTQETLEPENVRRFENCNEASAKNLLNAEGTNGLEHSAAQVVIVDPEEIERTEKLEDQCVLNLQKDEGRELAENSVTKFVIVNSEVIPFVEGMVDPCLLSQPEFSNTEGSGAPVVPVEFQSRSTIEESEDCFIVNHPGLGRRESTEKPKAGCVTVNHPECDDVESIESLKAGPVTVEMGNKSLIEEEDCLIVDLPEHEKRASIEGSKEEQLTVTPESISMIEHGDCLIINQSEKKSGGSAKNSEHVGRGRAEAGYVSMLSEHVRNGDQCCYTGVVDHSELESIKNFKAGSLTAKPVNVEKVQEEDCFIMDRTEHNSKECIENSKSECVTLKATVEGENCLNGVQLEPERIRSSENLKTKVVAVQPQGIQRNVGWKESCIVEKPDSETRESSENSTVKFVSVKLEREMIVEWENYCDVGPPKPEHTDKCKAGLATVNQDVRSTIKELEDSSIIHHTGHSKRRRMRNSVARLVTVKPGRQSKNEECDRPSIMDHRETEESTTNSKAGIVTVKSEHIQSVEAYGHSDISPSPKLDLEDRPDYYKSSFMNVKGDMPKINKWERQFTMDHSELKSGNCTGYSTTDIVTVKPEETVVVESENYCKVGSPEPKSTNDCNAGVWTVKQESKSMVKKLGRSCTLDDPEPGRRRDIKNSEAGLVSVKPERQTKCEGKEMLSMEPKRRECAENTKVGFLTMKSEQTRGGDQGDIPYKIDARKTESREYINNLVLGFENVKPENMATGVEWEKSPLTAPPVPKVKERTGICSASFIAVKSESMSKSEEQERLLPIDDPEPERKESTEILKAGFVNVKFEHSQDNKEYENSIQMSRLEPENQVNSKNCKEECVTLKLERMSKFDKLKDLCILDPRGQIESMKNSKIGLLSLKQESKETSEPSKILSATDHIEPDSRESTENSKIRVLTVNNDNIQTVEEYEDPYRLDHPQPESRESSGSTVVGLMNLKPGSMSSIVEWKASCTTDQPPCARESSEARRAEFVKLKEKSLSKIEEWEGPSTSDCEVSSSREGLEPFLPLESHGREYNALSNIAVTFNETSATVPYQAHAINTIAKNAFSGETSLPTECQTEKQRFIVVNNEIIPVAEEVEQRFIEDRQGSESMESSDEYDFFSPRGSDDGHRNNSKSKHASYSEELEMNTALSGNNQIEFSQRTQLRESTKRNIHLQGELINPGEKRLDECLEYESSFNKDITFTTLRSHKETKAYMCAEQGKDFRTSSALDTYQGMSRREKPGNYSELGRMFNMLSTISSNQQAHVGERPYACMECGKCFRFSASLHRHRREHTGESPYPCMVCGKSFSTPSSLLWHQHIHTGEKSYTCMVCGKSFSTPSSLLWHQHIHTGEKPHACAKCGKTFRSKSNLQRHQRVHTEIKPYSCAVCGRCFKDTATLQRHEQIHTGPKPYTCTACDQGFNDPSSLHRHALIHTGPKLYSCPECGKSFNDPSSLHRHEQVHTVQNTFSRNVCDKGFSDSTSLHRHVQIHTGVKPFSCTECGKGFPDPSSLHTHYRTHTGEKLYPCTECGKRFLSPASMHRHEKLHSAEKPYVCIECGMSFRILSSLHVHQRIHTGETAYKCTECDKDFKAQSALHRHQQIHKRHKEKPYACAECGVRFSDSLSLHRHERSHIGEKSFHCAVCGKSFRIRKSLRIHFRIHTGEKPHTCTECGRSFSDPSSWRKHQRIHLRENSYPCALCRRSFSDALSLQRHKQVHTAEKEGDIEVMTYTTES